MAVQEITRRLDLEPTSSGEAGDARYSSRGVERRISVSQWFLESEANVGSKNFPDHLAWLLDRVGNKAEELDALRADGVEVQLRCVWWAGGTEPADGPTVPAHQMRALAGLGMDLRFDFKDYSD